MEKSKYSKILPVLALAIFVFGVSCWLSNNYLYNDEQVTTVFSETSESNKIVTVRNTAMINGELPPPAGFPQDIPIESSEIVESAVTDYPAQNNRQLSLSYESSEALTEKYAEYKSYLEASGYRVVEEDNGTSKKVIVGTKYNVDLAIAMSASGGKTVVALSYLLKSSAN